MNRRRTTRPYRVYRRKYASNRRRTLNRRTGGYRGIETKFIDSWLTAAAITSPTDCTGGERDPSTQQCLNGITQGVGESNRIGRRFRMQNISIKGIVETTKQTNLTTDPGFAPTVSLWLVLDKQTNETQLNSEDVFVNPSANGRLATECHFNLENKDRFIILKKKTMTFGIPNGYNDAAGTGAYGSNVRTFSMYKNLKGLRVNTSGTTNTIGNITDKSLHLIAFTNSVSLAPLLFYNARLRFTD